MPYLDTGEVKLHYCVGGADGAPWVTLSHSIGGDHSMWDGVAERLSGAFRVLQYDTRGHGRSAFTGVARSASLDDLAEDVIALWDALGVEGSHFVGVSLGGIAGLTLALRHGERLNKLVLCDCRAEANDAFRELWVARARKVREEGMASVVSDTLSLWFTPSFRAAHPDLMDKVGSVVRATSSEGYLACAAAVQSLDYTARLGEISVPTQLIVGAEDGPHPAIMREMAERIKDARYDEIADAAHIPNIEKLDRFNAVLLAFLEEDV